jgi:RimJ/RimL family protein N-acetyltransferase
VAVELVTERLALRGWRDSDRVPFAELNADPEVMRYFPSRLTREHSDAMIDRIESGFEREGFGLWAVELLETGEFVGFVGLARPKFDARLAEHTEIGWRLARQAWGYGYATEAAREALRYAFDPACANLAEVISFTAAINLRSRAVMERIGMMHDESDDFEHPSLPPGHALRPHVLYRLAKPGTSPQ